MPTKKKPELPSVKKSAKRHLKNLHYKSLIKSYTKKLHQSLEEKNLSAAKELLVEATSVIGKAKSKGAIHWKTASRKISRLAQKLNHANLS